MDLKRSTAEAMKDSTRKLKSWMAYLRRLWDVRAELDPRLMWVLWMAGACFVAISVLAIHIVSTSSAPASEEQCPADSDEELRVAIYTAPDPFEGSVGRRQADAIDSWLRLDPHLTVVLFAQHSSAHAFATSRGPLVTVDSGIDFTFFGKPLFHGMLQRALNSSADIIMMVDAHVFLLNNVLLAVKSLHRFKQDWLLTALPHLVPDLPYSLHGEWFESLGVQVDDAQVESYVKANGKLDTCNGAQLWAWNGNRKPLHAGVMPPFVYGEGHHNHWLLAEAITSKHRVVLDGSKAFSSFRIQDVLENRHGISSSLLVNKTVSNRVWGISDNKWLASSYGSYFFRPHNFSDIVVKIVKCGGLQSEMFCLMNTSQHPCSCSPINSLAVTSKRSSSCKQKGTWALLSRPPAWTSWFEDRVSHIIAEPVASSWYAAGSTHLYSWVEETMVFPRVQISNCGCNELPSYQSEQCTDSKLTGSEIVKSKLSYSLESLVGRIASEDKVIILAVVGNSYRDMLMSWVCRLKHLQISNFLVSALDDDIHHFAILQGLPVFRSMLDQNVSRDDCHFGSQCFQNVTKMKSQTVLKILQLGFHVLFSDVDVYWFHNPLKELSSFGVGQLPAQTDQWNESAPSNEPRRLNSGFYFAHADQYIIAAFKKIIKHAASSSKSEQPSFYDTLCGADGEYRVGNDTCMEPELNVTVHFLDPNRYPNGAYKSLWDQANVRSACLAQGCLLLHNNWVPGRKKKLDRQISAGLWDYDSGTRLCLTQTMTTLDHEARP